MSKTETEKELETETEFISDTEVVTVRYCWSLRQ